VFSRLLTESRELAPHSNGGTRFDLNVVEWDREVVARLVKGLALAIIVLGAFLCRTRYGGRDDPRLLGEFSLVVLTMLFVSERSWKHHYVTVILPLAYLSYRVATPLLAERVRWILLGALGLFAALMATTSSEFGGYFAAGQGHEYALYFGMYFWSGVVLYIATSWCVWAERDVSPFAGSNQTPSSLASSRPHFGSSSLRSDAAR
jgi:hypothetical protein